MPEADEPHCTFVENALAKARHASQLTKLAGFSRRLRYLHQRLGGAPGVYSARFACEGNEPKSDLRNNAKMIAQLAGVTDRRAHYVAVLVLLRCADDPQPIIAQGEWHGEIVDTPRGDGGFGYDPHFYLPELKMTAAELAPAAKNRISHRGKALAQLIAMLRQDAAI